MQPKNSLTPTYIVMVVLTVIVVVVSITSLVMLQKDKKKYGSNSNQSFGSLLTQEPASSDEELNDSLSSKGFGSGEGKTVKAQCGGAEFAYFTAKADATIAKVSPGNSGARLELSDVNAQDASGKKIDIKENYEADVSTFVYDSGCKEVNVAAIKPGQKATVYFGIPQSPYVDQIELK